MRFAFVAVLAACGDNGAASPPCVGLEPVIARVVPLHTTVRTLPSLELLLAGTFTELDGVTSAGGTDVFLAKLDDNVRAFGDGADQELRAMVTDAAGNVVIAGRFNGAIDFGGGPLVASGTSSFFVASFDADGAHRFSKAYPVEAILRSLAVSPTGDVAIAGSNFDPVDFGGGVLPTGSQFLAVLDRSGNHVTSRRLASEDVSVNLDVNVAFDGTDLVVVGSFTNSIDLGGGPLASAGLVDFYVARFGRGGAHRASRSFGGPGNDGYQGFDGDRLLVAPTADGLVVAGGFNGTIDLGDGPIASQDELDDVFVMRLDDSLATEWTRVFTRPGFQSAGALALAPDGTIAITGTAMGGKLPGTALACGGGDFTNVYATTLDRDGAVRWTTCFEGEFGAGLSLAFRGNDEVVVGGTFSGDLAIGTTALPGDNLTGFVTSVRPTCP